MLNYEIIKEIIPKNNRKIAAIDASYIKKVENKVMGLIIFGMVRSVSVKKDKKYHYFLLLI
jgi:exopolysaccharide biosynthesis protein